MLCLAGACGEEHSQHEAALLDRASSPRFLTMALKRVRFALEDERCEHCSQTSRKLKRRLQG